MAQQAGAAVENVRRLAGASTSAVHGLWLADGTRLVLRRYVWPGVLEDEPIIPQREVDVLRFAHAWGLAVPEFVAADVTGEEVGDGVPALLMTMLPGRAVGDPDLGRLAEVAAGIHAIDATKLGHDYFPWYQGTTTAPPPGSNWPALWERAIELWQNEMPAYEPTFIHRDFHPGNVLWFRGRLSGVVDWANGCRGPRGCDLAHCRANLRGLADEEAADRFLSVYESLTGETHHPYWEIASVLEHGPSAWTPPQLAESEPVLARAVGSLVSLPARR